MEQRHRAEGQVRKARSTGLLSLVLLFFLLDMSFLFLSPLPALAEGISGWGNLNRTTTTQYEDSKKTASQNISNENVYLRLDKPITPALSYQLYLRTNVNDTRSTDATGNRTATYQRAAEPAIDLFLRNPMYSLDSGYRRLEQWSTAAIRNQSRRTSDFYYSRLNVTPFEFPSLLLQFDRQRDYDYLSPSKLDATNTRYSGSTAYKFPYRNLDLSYNLYYTRTTNETPLSSMFKTENDNFSGMYNIGYTKSFKEGRYTASAVYQGNYARNKNQQFITSMTGSASLKRTPQQGLYEKGSNVDTLPTPHEPFHPENINTLKSNGALVDGVLIVPTAINIGQNLADPVVNEFHNIGLQLLSSDKSVDSLFIYVQSTSNLISDPNLSNPATWKVYMSNTNSSFSPTNDWSSVTVLSVAVTVFDAPNNIYRVEIRLTSPQKALYFKAVNMNTAAANNVFVTEIEAYGTDVVPATGKVVDTVTLFNQGLNFNVNMRPTPKLNFSLNYLINRTDTNPISTWDSLGGIFSDIFSKATEGQTQNSRFRSNVTKTYGAGSTWMAHRLLTTTMRVQRNETFDNKGQTDTASNIYSLAFTSAPLPTLNTNLSLIRNDNYNLGVKQTTNNSVLLNIGSKLYRDVNMTTDIGYTQTQSHLANTASSSSRYIRGTLDATITPKLFSTLVYGFNWTDSGGRTQKTEEGSTIITYRPSRLVNISGTFRLANSDGNLSSSEGVLIDWLPLPVLKMNLNYQHTRTEPGPTISDSFNNYAIWYITKFLDLQLAYGFSENVASGKSTKSYNFGLNLNCRFW